MSSPANAQRWPFAETERNDFSQSRGKERLEFGAQPRFRGIWVQVTYAIIDSLCIVGNGLMAFVLFHPGPKNHFVESAYRTVIKHEPLSGYGGFLLLNATLILLFCQSQGLYRTPRTRAPLAEVFEVVRALLYATLLVIAFIYLTGVNIVSPQVMLTDFLLNLGTLITWRYAKRRVVLHRIERGIGARNTIIIGAGSIGKALAERLRESKMLGYRFKGFLDDRAAADDSVIGATADLPRIMKAEFVDEIFVTIPWERETVKRVAVEARKHRVSVKVIPDFFDGLAWNAPLSYVADVPVMELYWRPISVLQNLAKRLLDVVLATFALVALLPWLALMAAWIKWDSEGPMLYRAPRVGRKGKKFTCYKLRTMVANADDLKESLRLRNEREGPFFKIDDDPRVTGAGKFLRKYSLDELPQLWNVLKGEMSLVGPRPHPLDDYAQYGLDQLRRLEVKPGLTGLWQVTARRDPSFERNMTLDLKYIESWSFLLDLRLLLQTVPVVLRGEGQ